MTSGERKWKYFAWASAFALAVALFLAPRALSFTQKTRSFNVASFPARSTASVKCPKGQHVFGGGVSAHASSVVLVASFPFDGKDRDKRPDDGWRVRVDNRDAATTAHVAAVCAARQPTYRTQSFKAVPGDQSTSSALCGHGRHVTGGGVDYAPPAGDGLIADTFPGTRREWAVYIDNYGAKRLPATAYATCAKGDFKKVRGGFFQVPAFGALDGSAECPGGKQATGGGVLSEYNDGPDYDTSGINTSFPIDGGDADLAPDDAWRAQTVSFASGEVFSEAMAICVK